MKRRPPVLVLAVLPLLVACGGGSSSGADATEPAGPHAPTATAQAAAVDAEGRTVELDDAGSVVVPADAQVEERSTGSAARQLVVTFDDPLTAVEITWAPDDTISVDEQTWTTEQAARGNAAISGYERARVQWPGSQQSVLATWVEEVPAQDGAASEVEAVRLVVQDEAGTTVAAVAVAPAGTLEGSAAEAVVLSLTLG